MRFITSRHWLGRRVLVAAISFTTAAMAASPAAAELLDPDTQPKFVNPLPRPLRIDATAGGSFDVTMKECGPQWLGLYDPDTGAPMPTTVWGYELAGGPCTYPGPTFLAREASYIDVFWRNGLVDWQGDPLDHLLPVDTSLHWADPDEGVPLVTHLHGGHTESASDGLPEAWFTPDFEEVGPHWIKALYRYDNDQEAATLWYHDHALGVTRLNVYAGLAGFYLLRDANEEAMIAADQLPSGPYEVELVIQDRLFEESGELFYPAEPEEPGAPFPSVLPEFFGDHILVNGMAWPVLEVEPRKYRFRMLNGSDSRFYEMWIAGDNTRRGGPAGPDFIQIGTDDGFLYQPVWHHQLTFGPGERLDVVIDFADFAGQTLVLRNNARSPYPKGDTVDPNADGQIMAFRVSPAPVEDPVTLPATLRPQPFDVAVPPGVMVRQVALFEAEDEYGRLRPQLGIIDPYSPLNGSLLWTDPITENPQLGETEVWEIFNATEDAHPIHLHLVAFEVLGRQRFKADLFEFEEQGGTKLILSDVKTIGQAKPPGLDEQGPKDTVRAFPGEVTRVVAHFDRPGRYVWHCHILSHEDHEMMRPYCVGPMAGCEPG